MHVVHEVIYDLHVQIYSKCRWHDSKARGETQFYGQSKSWTCNLQITGLGHMVFWEEDEVDSALALGVEGDLVRSMISIADKINKGGAQENCKREREMDAFLWVGRFIAERLQSNLPICPCTGTQNFIDLGFGNGARITLSQIVKPKFTK